MDSYNNHYKIVDFKWCNRCINKSKAETEKPCDECLSNPVNTDSRRPLYFKSTGSSKKNDIGNE